MTAINIASTGAIAQTQAIDNIANNIANINTVSFKKAYIATTDLSYTTEKRYGLALDTNSSLVTPTGIQFGSGTAVVATVRDQKQGDAINTGNQLDVRIDGNGYFVLNMPDGTLAYTRDGRFQIDPNTNQIVTNHGYSVSPGINLPDNYKSISIQEDGNVMVTLPGEETLQQIGQLDMAIFVNNVGLALDGNNIYLQTDGSGPALLGTPSQDGYGRLFAGWLEGSNVQAIIEMTDLITAQRGYEMNMKVISTSDKMMEKIVNV